MWHRGNEAKARDLFDLCAVATFETEAIDIALWSDTQRRS
ncbi:MULTISPECIES: hypothetical protein [Variovorax]